MNAWYDIGALVRGRHGLALAVERTDSRLFGVTSSPRLLPAETGVARRLADATIAMRADNEWLLEAASRLQRPFTVARGDGLDEEPTSPNPSFPEIFNVCFDVWTPHVDNVCLDDWMPPDFPDFAKFFMCITSIYCPWAPGWSPPGEPEDPDSPSPPSEPDDPDTDEPPGGDDPIKEAAKACSFARNPFMPSGAFADCMCLKGIAAYCGSDGGGGGGLPDNDAPDKGAEDGGGDDEDSTDTGLGFRWA